MKVDKNTIRELMSYEMLMQLVLNYLKTQKEGRQSIASHHSINKKNSDEEAQIPTGEEEEERVATI